MTACICRPRDPEGWYREDCPTHGREAQDQREDEANSPRWAIAMVLDEHQPWYQDGYLTGEPPFFTCGRFDPDSPGCEWKSDPGDPDDGTQHRLHVADVLLHRLGIEVEAIAAQRAARELREAASDVDDGEFSSRESAAARRVILARADELAPR